MKYRLVREEHINGNVYWHTERQILWMWWIVSWSLSARYETAYKTFNDLVAGRLPSRKILEVKTRKD
jgi:hypothetical protein